MKIFRLAPYLLLGTLAADSHAAEIRFNGFASVVAGMTIDEGTVIEKNALGISTGETRKVEFEADSPSGGVYDDDISFKPDTIFGLQISADLGAGLSVTGQITGAGGEDFDANIAWAYISYKLNDSWTLVAGRQRVPLFFYSDFLDVGYAYHWMRAPIETQVPADTLDGIQFRHEGNLGNWDTRLQLVGGTSDNDSETLGETVVFEDVIGGTFYISNDWLQLRAVHAIGEFHIDADSALDGASEDTALDVAFSGIAAHMTLGQGFIVSEYITYSFEDPVQPVGWDVYDAAYISAGYRFGNLTPHITLSTETQEIKDSVYAALDAIPGVVGLTDGDDSTDSITIGVRWDFHPQAAFKVEYQTRSDESDSNIEAYYGDRNEVDLVSVGFDVIF